MKHGNINGHRYRESGRGRGSLLARVRAFLLLLALTLLGAQPSAAAPSELSGASGELSEESDLGDYLRYAALNNPGLEAARQRWQASQTERARVSSLPQPRFSYGYFLEPIETRVGPQRQRFGLYQNLPWFGERGLAGEVADLDAAAEGERQAEARLALFQEIATAYGELYIIERELAITRSNLRLLEDLEGVARARYRTGGASQAIILDAQIQRAYLADEAESLIDLRPVLRAQLNTALGRPADAVLPIVARLPGDEDPFWMRADETARAAASAAVESLVASSPALRVTDLQRRGRRLAVELAGKDFYPDFTLGIEYIQTDPARMPDVQDSGRDAMVATLSLRLPLWRGGLGAASAGAAARYREAEHHHDQVSLGRTSLLKRAAHAYRDAARQVALYRDSLIPQARQALAVFQEAFSAGQSDFQQLVEAQRTLMEFELSLEQARVDRLQASAEMARLTGWDLEDLDHE